MKSLNRLTVTLDKNNKLHYFDYAATTFMSKEVMDKWIEVNSLSGVSLGRGNSILTKKASSYFDESNKRILDFFNLSKNYYNIYAKNVTEAINLIALGLDNYLKPLDIIVVGPFEHHSNYLPWKYLAKRTGALFFEIPLDKKGNVDYDYLNRYKDRIKIVSVSSVSNSFGFKLDINKICKRINDNTLLLVDESQIVAHEKINTNKRVGIHFLPSHKMYGPKGIAASAVRKDLINIINPSILGGGMVDNVSYEDTWLDNERKFMSGTFDVSLVSAWAEACSFLNKNDYLNQNKTNEYYKKIIKTLKDNNYIIISNKDCAKYIISFIHPSIHAHDINEYLSEKNIIIRSGNLCSQNAIRKIETNAINRISLGIDTTDEDVEALCEELRRLSL